MANGGFSHILKPNSRSLDHVPYFEVTFSSLEQGVYVFPLQNFAANGKINIPSLMILLFSCPFRFISAAISDLCQPRHACVGFCTSREMKTKYNFIPGRVPDTIGYARDGALDTCSLRNSPSRCSQIRDRSCRQKFSCGSFFDRPWLLRRRYSRRGGRHRLFQSSIALRDCKWSFSGLLS